MSPPGREQSQTAVLRQAQDRPQDGLASGRSPKREYRSAQHGGTRATRPRRLQQRGAALLLAMMIVALVATLTSGMVWQQWRAIQVESAERARTQSSWILTGALDWSRLILREDARSGRIDHLGEPWATPLAEARLSTFLAADKDNNVDTGPEAFLSGAITDAQSRYNLRNLFGDDGKADPVELLVLNRLCDSAGLPSDLADRLVKGLGSSWRVGVTDNPNDTTQPLAIQRLAQLSWLGIEAQWIEALAPVVDILPTRTAVNVNTASREVLAAVLDIDLGTAERLVQMRQRAAFESLDKVQQQLRPDVVLKENRVSVASSFFVVTGRLRLDERVLEERSVVQRRGNGAGSEVAMIRRERSTQSAAMP
jgi:general secretion pathway protein K